jgi:hypothetical protein
MPSYRIRGRAKWTAAVSSGAVAAGLVASLGLGAFGANAAPAANGNANEPTLNTAADGTSVAAGPSAPLGLDFVRAKAPSGWKGNRPPKILKSAPAGTPISAPAKNTLFACVDVIGPDGKPYVVGQQIGRTLTQADTPWVKDGDRVVISEIEKVPGKVKMKSVFKITETKTTRTFTGNGIPNFPIGRFPIPKNSSAYSYYGVLPSSPPYANAAEIPALPYDLKVKLPKNPKIAAKPSCFRELTIGVALVGAAWHAEVAVDANANAYDPNTALPTDRCFGHPYATQYHVHGYSWKCMDKGKPGKPSPLVGYALDGFGIYGPRGADGKLVTNAELDECHGRVGEVMFNGKKQMMYHYVLNNEYPYSIGCFRGTPQPFDHGGAQHGH